MSDNLKKIKENEKSEIYENSTYIVKISDINGYFYKKNGEDFTDYDSELPDNDYKFVKAIRLQIKNKKTGKTSQKRCYQDYDELLNDVQRDLNTNKSQFKSIWKKIDF